MSACFDAHYTKNWRDISGKRMIKDYPTARAKIQVRPATLHQAFILVSGIFTVTDLINRQE